MCTGAVSVERGAHFVGRFGVWDGEMGTVAGTSPPASRSTTNAGLTISDGFGAEWDLRQRLIGELNMAVTESHP